MSNSAPNRGLLTAKVDSARLQFDEDKLLISLDANELLRKARPC